MQTETVEQIQLMELITHLLNATTAMVQLPWPLRSRLAEQNGPTAQALLDAVKRIDGLLTAQNGPECPGTDVLSSLPPATPPTAQEAAIPPGSRKAAPAPKPRKGKGAMALPFAEFDDLCRKEMKRLAMDGRMPGYRLWNAERDPRLPTLGGVVARYNVPGLIELAAELGLETPFSLKIKDTDDEPAD
ncbi:MAG TPA: hypothetical protein PKA43_00035 [Candidatus Competibacter phosphatis]|nr:hypothetical protein [Candidatus Competibacter phosphatis]